jgi:predicted amidohydrolase
LHSSPKLSPGEAVACTNTSPGDYTSLLDKHIRSTSQQRYENILAHHEPLTKSRRHLEDYEEGFFNTFVLTAPTGEEAGRVRKQFPAIWEAYFFKGDLGSHVIETALGKIGVGICFDSHLAAIVRLSHPGWQSGRGR